MSVLATSAALPSKLGPYEILKKVGEGSVGTVYLAEDMRLGRRVALKVPRLGGAEEPRALGRFQRAGWLAASLTHPNVCTIFDVGQVEGVPFLVMEFLDGTPLSAVIEKHKPWPVRRALTLVAEIARALAEVHDKGVLHGGLKPSNILLLPGGRPVLVDFGLTGLGQTPGTPPFVSPEQIRTGPGSSGPGADVYALGVILYQLLTGEPPFAGSPEAVLAQTLNARPRGPSALRGTLATALDDLCLKALAKRPQGRYPTMGAFADALAEALRRFRPAGSSPEVSVSPDESAPTSPPPVRGPALPPQRLACRSCGKRVRIPPALVRKALKCPRCRSPLGPARTPPPVPTPSQEPVEVMPVFEPLPGFLPATDLPYTTGELLMAGGAVGALLALLFWGLVGVGVLVL